MGTRRDRSSELRELANALFRLVREHEIATNYRVKAGGALGRILQHSPEWRALRGSQKKTKPRAAKEPSYFTIVDAADELKVPICAFVPTIEHQPLTEPQRKVLTLFARWTLANFARRNEERTAYTSDFEDFEAFTTIRKQAQAIAASQVGTDSQFEPGEASVLASIPGIRDERLQVITVRGDSMAGRIHHGDRVLIDIERRTPRNGEMVAVDRDHLGRTIGYWRRDGKRCYLDKENEPAIDLGMPGDFTILGTITGIVWAPFHGRPRSR
ncbi:MAG TPA: S24 family peptidase [Thermoanaerobaculia bacterium]|nr:S24 family peptidase [Thermoanaerobaculia bacterium]